MNFRFSIFDFRFRTARQRLVADLGCRQSKIENPKSKIFRGFTLLEVLIALTIFALAAVVLGASYVNVLLSYQIAARSTQGDEDVKFARAQLLAIADPKKIEEGGDFDAPGGRRVHWSAQIEPTETADLFLVHFLCEINDPATPDAPKIAQDFRVLRPRGPIRPSATSCGRRRASGSRS